MNKTTIYQSIDSLDDKLNKLKTERPLDFNESILYSVTKHSNETVELTIFEDDASCTIVLSLEMANQMASLLIH